LITSPSVVKLLFIFAPSLNLSLNILEGNIIKILPLTSDLLRQLNLPFHYLLLEYHI